MSTSQKQYGLLVPKKGHQGHLKPRLAIFGDNSDSDNEGGDWVKKALKRDAEKSVKKQTKLEMQRALEQDPTVYQYDEVYDKMEERKIETKALKKDQQKKPRYIQSLLMQAERRKREQERRVEREVQKEREAEGEEFKDKEAFVTSAYREKLEEFNKMDEEERRQDQIEAITDVSKQNDLGGFYRHLYRETVCKEEPSSEVKIKKEKPDDEKNEAENSETSETVRSSTHRTKEQRIEKKQRHYRKRRSSSSESEKEENKETTVEKNLDADSDFTGNSSSSSSDSDSDSSVGEKSKKDKNKIEKQDKKPEETVVTQEAFTSGSEEGEIIEASEEKKRTKRKHSLENSNDHSQNDGKKAKDDLGDANGENEKSTDEKQSDKENNEPEVPKRSIWEKRTVGPVFEAALQRYFARKAAKSEGNYSLT